MALIEYRHECSSCGVAFGVRHRVACDVARCATHGSQFAQHLPSCRPTVWTGYFPATLEAVEFDYFCYWDTDLNAWVPCSAGHPNAMPDLNRVVIECEWDRTTERFVRSTGPRGDR